MKYKLALISMALFLIGCSALPDAASKSTGAISQATQQGLTYAVYEKYYDPRFAMVMEEEEESPQTMESLEAGRAADVVAFGSPVVTMPSNYVSFEEPILGFEEPILGFEEPILGFEDPFFFDVPLMDFEDPFFITTGSWEEFGSGELISSEELATLEGVPVLIPVPTYPSAGLADGGQEQLAHFFLPISISTEAMSSKPEAVAAFVESMIAITDKFGNSPELYLEALETSGVPIDKYIEALGDKGMTSWLSPLPRYSVGTPLFTDYAKQAGELPLEWAGRAVVLLGADGTVTLVPSLLVGNYAVVAPDLAPGLRLNSTYYATEVFQPDGQFFVPETMGLNTGYFIDRNSLVFGMHFEPSIP